MKTNNDNFLSHPIKQKEEMIVTAFLIQSTRDYHRKQQKKSC